MIQPLVGVYSQLGYTVILASAQTKLGIKPLRAELRDRETVVVGQSGVGKSSLLNALEPKFHLKVGGVSAASRKGRHTTTTAQLLRLAEGGTVVDTPGIRQLGLEELEADEVAAHFPEIRPFAIHCRLPGCTHTHEERCAVKTAVRDGCMTSGRYQSYVRLLRGEERGGGGDD